MADTVITPSVDRGDSGAAGWAVAVIVLIGVVLIGIFIWPGVGRVTPAGNASTPGTIDVNVQLPQGQGQQGTNPGSGGTQPSGSGAVPAPAQ